MESLTDSLRYEAGALLLRRFTSIPRNVLGAHDASTHGNPHADIRKVAKRKDRTNGAMIIMALKRQCPQIQAVSRSGLYLLTLVAIAAIAAAGRGVKLCSSGDLMRRGNTKAPAVVTRENKTREKLPILPISPNGSFEVLKSCGASYL